MKQLAINDRSECVEILTLAGGNILDEAISFSFVKVEVDRVSV